jgi:hypothetical protein
VETALLVIQTLTLIALIAYVWKTWEMADATRKAAEAAASSVEEMRRGRREASDPRVAVYFASPSSSLSEIVIENFGETTATNVTFDFVPPLQSSENHAFGVQFFATPKTLPPRSRLQHAFDTWPEYFDAKLPKKYEVRVRYQRLGEDVVREELHVLDAAAFEHYATWHVLGIHELASRFKQYAERTERLFQQAQDHGKVVARRADLIAPTRELGDSLSDLLTMLEAVEAGSADGEVSMFPGQFLPALKRHAVTTLLAAHRKGGNGELQSALKELLLALHHRDWDLLNKTKANARLNSAIGKLRDAVSGPEPPAA